MQGTVEGADVGQLALPHPLVTGGAEAARASKSMIHTRTETKEMEKKHEISNPNEHTQADDLLTVTING